MPFSNTTPDDAWTRHAEASEPVQVAFTEGPAATLNAALTHAPHDGPPDTFEGHESHEPGWLYLEGTWHITDHEGETVESGTLTAGKRDDNTGLWLHGCIMAAYYEGALESDLSKYRLHVDAVGADGTAVYARSVTVWRNRRRVYDEYQPRCTTSRALYHMQGPLLPLPAQYRRAVIHEPKERERGLGYWDGKPASVVFGVQSDFAPPSYRAHY